MNSVSQAKLVLLIQDAIKSGKFFSVTFRKRTTGEIRTIVGKKTKWENLTGRKKPFKSSQKGLIPIYDVSVRGWRSIPVERAVCAKIGGVSYIVV